MIKYVIVANNQGQARLFCERQRWQLSEVRYASSPTMLQGICNLSVIYLPGWWKNPRAKEINQCIALAASLSLCNLKFFDTNIDKSVIRLHDKFFRFPPSLNVSGEWCQDSC